MIFIKISPQIPDITKSSAYFQNYFPQKTGNRNWQMVIDDRPLNPFDLIWFDLIWFDLIWFDPPDYIKETYTWLFLPPNYVILHLD